MDRRHLLVALTTIAGGCAKSRQIADGSTTAAPSSTTAPSDSKTPTSAPDLPVPNGVVPPAGGIESVERDGDRVRVETYAGDDFEYALVTVTRTEESGTVLSTQQVARHPPLQNCLAYLSPDVRTVELQTSVSNGDSLQNALQQYETTTDSGSKIGPFTVESVSFDVGVGKTG